MGLNIEKLAPNLFYLDVRVRRPDGPGEDRIRENFQGTKEAAENRYITLRKDIKERQGQRCRFETFADILRWYADERPPAPKDASIMRILAAALGAVSLPAFPDRFAAYRKHVQRYPSAKTGAPLSNGTVNRYTNIVRAAFQLAVDQDPPILEKNPITKAKFPRMDEIPRDTVLAPETRRLVFSIMERRAPWIIPITLYALAVPCRKSEMVRMGRDDLDLVNNLIRVKNGTTKNDMGVWKPIPPELIPYFRSIPAACPYLFYRVKKGKYLSIGDFKKAWGGVLKEAGVVDFRFHDTRHMSATDLLNNGTPPRAVQDIAGWKTDMMRIYFHRDSAASAALARFSPGVRTIGAYTREDLEKKTVAG